MKRGHVLIAAVAAFAACLFVPLVGVAAGPPDVVCSQVTNTFTGTAHDLIVPTGGYCAVTGATITHDLIQQDHAGRGRLGDERRPRRALPERRGSGHRRTRPSATTSSPPATSPAPVSSIRRSGTTSSRSGRIPASTSPASTVVHDVRLLGLADGMHVERRHHRARLLRVEAADGADRSDRPGHAGRPRERRSRLRDRRLARPARSSSTASATSTSLTTSASRTARSRSGSGSATSAPGTASRRTRSAATWSSPATRRSSGFFGPSALIVGDNHVGRDLVFSNNTAVPGGTLEVSRNVVGRDATCAGNNPAVTVNGPNSAGRSNTCG